MGPEQISRLSEAYEQTLKALSLKDRNDPLSKMIAKKIIRDRPDQREGPGADFPTRDRGSRNPVRRGAPA